MRFEEKVVMISGAASGIGQAAAVRFAAEGAVLVLLDVAGKGLEETRDALPAGTQVTLHVIDVRDMSAWDAVVEQTLAAYGRIDVLCNNAGIAGEDYSPIYVNDPLAWGAIFEVNVMGVVNGIRAVGPHMVTRQQGAIVNTASVAGIRSGAGGNAYSASKAAVINITQTAACDFGINKIRVNAVCPGLVRSGMTQAVFDYAIANNKQDKLGSRCELRRHGEPSEIAAAIAFLASDDASYITGQALAVDGGNTASLNMPGMKV